MRNSGWMVLAGLAIGMLMCANVRGGERVRSGLLVLYDFYSSTGEIVRDRSGVGKSLDLRIDSPEKVVRAQGSLEVREATLIRSDGPATKIIETVRQTGEITIEAWMRPADDQLRGPARIVTLSASSSMRNFTLGQEGNRFDVRFTTTKTGPNGLPSVTSPLNSLSTSLTHVVYTRDRSGRTRIYMDGKQTAEEMRQGTTEEWQGLFRLALANEFGGARAWLGVYRLVAVYGRDLSAEEIEQNFLAGPAARSAPEQLAATSTSPGSQRFDSQIAPLLAKHCLECHDSVTKEGGLDLSRKDSAFAGGDSGKAIVPGKAVESLLWEQVETDMMPSDRPPLSQQQKELLRGWIDSGATWSMDTIDPAFYEHDGLASNWLQRLTVPEYIETVRSAVGVDVAKEAREILPPDLRADGFSNTAYNLSVDLKHVEAYAQLAEIIVGKMDVLEFAGRFSKSRRLIDKDNRALIARMGKWLLRGPLNQQEIAVYRGIATTVASVGGDFEEATQCIIESMLQSPRFIYRIENQRGDGTAWRVGEYELASRLSYILWGGPPDSELMRAADDGELYDREHLNGQIGRMLQDPRALQRARQFIYEWLNLARLDNLQPNRVKFPNWNEWLAADMRDETLAFFQDVAWEQKRPLADLLNAQVTYATPRLAAHYGLQQSAARETELPGAGLAQDGLPGEGPPGNARRWSRYDLSSVPARGGLLTQGSVLTVGGDEASMVTRGLFVLRDFLRGTVKDPPPCVDTTPVPTKAGLTQRGIAEARIADANCGGCHAKFEPLAFGLEKFDGLGSYHEHDEHGNKLRDDGEIVIPGHGKPAAYQSAAELMDLLAQSERVRECLTWKLAQFALGRPLVQTDVPLLDRIHQEAQQGGGTYVSLVSAIVTSDLVQTTRTETIE